MSDFLAVNQLKKGFPYGGGRLEVLKDVSCGLPKGTSGSIIGESGSGKSTLLHILGGMEPPDDGEIRLGETNVFQLTAEDRAKWRNRAIGFVFQFHHLMPEFNSLENLMMPLLIRSMPADSIREQAIRTLAELGLENRAQSRPGELSGGEQQRLAIGRAMITAPDLLLMDEPTGNLDHPTGDRIMELVFSLLRQRGITMLLVTHNRELAARCEFQFRMSDGRLELISGSKDREHE